jgi:SAM-dependent methyltransferase
MPMGSVMPATLSSDSLSSSGDLDIPILEAGAVITTIVGLGTVAVAVQRIMERKRARSKQGRRGVSKACIPDEPASRDAATTHETGSVSVNKSMSILGFKVMAFGFRVRDTFRPRIDILQEAGIKKGSLVLDYGCGPGGYIPPLAGIVGPTGQIYALDRHPAAVEATRRVALRKKIKNIRMIASDCGTGLPDASVDTVLLYDVLHHLSRPDDVLGELHRILKSGGILSLSDHHMADPEITAAVAGSGMFELVKKGRRTYSFTKVLR